MLEGVAAMCVFFISILLLAYISLAIIGLLSVARNLWGRPWAPASSFSESGDLED
jgi:hypothetical protein